MQPHELLAQVPLLAGLDEASRRVLARQLEMLEVPVHATVLSQGDAGDTLYLIREGTVQVVIHDADGHPSILATLGPGEYFGEMALLDDQPRSATIVARSLCRFLTLSRAPFHELVQHQPGIAISLLQEISRRLRACHRRVADLAVVDAYTRVGRFLLDHGVREGDRDREVLPMEWTVPAIAQQLELSEGMADQVFRELRTEGYIALDDGRIVILKHLVRPYELVGLLVW